ncbi:MAG: phosphoribosylpyrophosphate synthetase [Ignavibacteria bacterium]|nr:phosphoribosylpyrophosphate synthetase [Ignavibacteria bacterium]
MKNYDTLSEAINDLRKRGYVNDFNLKCDSIECNNLKLKLSPYDFEITEFYRFEGNSNPDDEEIIYAITSNKGEKGIIVDAYGIYSNQITNELLQKLKVKR